MIRSVIPEPGFLPDADYAAVRDVVNYVLDEADPHMPAGSLSSPELEDKIKFNKLSPEVGGLLVNGARQATVVKDFFSKRAGFHRQLLRDHLAAIYKEEKDMVQKRGKWADRLFFSVLQRITPPSSLMKRAVQDAAIVVMAFYFESCDVFEVPHAVA